MMAYKNIHFNSGAFGVYRNPLLGFILYAVLFFVIYNLLLFFNLINTVPDGTNVVKWDAVWYDSIRTKGYEYYWYMASNSAFFPLFSYVWKVLHLNGIGISVFNFLLFIFSILILVKNFSPETHKVLLYVSLPTSIFFFLPYSESFFFFFSTIFLVGLHKNNFRLIFWGLFFASLTRATALFFIPSIIAMEILNSESFLDKKGLKNILFYSSASVIGLLIVVLFQYVQTNEWFPFAKQQFRFWKHVLAIPEFPLLSHGGEKSLWIDSFAFFTGVCSFFILIAALIIKIFKKKITFETNKPFLFSSGYIVMLTLYSLFFNPKCLDAQTTIDSINRYIFSTSFFFVFFIFALRSFSFNFRNVALFIFLLIGVLFLSGLGTKLVFLGVNSSLLHSNLFFFSLFTYIFLHYLSSHPIYGKSIAYSLFTLNIILSILSLHNFITGNWAG
jgi:hypothetical protein